MLGKEQFFEQVRDFTFPGQHLLGPNLNVVPGWREAEDPKQAVLTYAWALWERRGGVGGPSKTPPR